MTMTYLVPGVFGALISCLFFLGLAVFVFLQRSGTYSLRRLALVAGGLAAFGLFPVLAIPLDLITSFLDYGSFPHTAANWLGRAVGAIGYYLGTGLVVAGVTLVARDIAMDAQPDEA